MSYKISKELFEAVMGESEHKKTLDCIIDDSILYHIPYSGNMEILINDFFFACKEWAYNQGWLLDSRTTQIGSCFLLSSPTIYENEIIKTFTADSEQQAVFNACQWILDNKDKR